MAKLFDRVGMSTSTAGTGTITLGTALGNVSPNLAGFSSFAGASVPNGTDVSYLILDANNNWEIGHGTYTSSGTTLTRNVTASSSSGSVINLSGNAQVFITIRAEDLITLDAGGNATFAGIFDITNSTASTSVTTGALQVTGGFGLGGDLHAGGQLLLDTAGRGITFNGSGGGFGNSTPLLGGRDGNQIAANGTLSISIGSGFVFYTDETAGGSAMFAFDGGTGQYGIVWQNGSSFTTTDPGVGTNKWWVKSNGNAVNRFSSLHGIAYLYCASVCNASPLV
jgi:hypothetical protein